MHAHSMSVIVGRALPDKTGSPIHRRILYTMHGLGLTADKPYRKSATVVGEVMGNYHPHGDAAIYDALVRWLRTFQCETLSSTATQLRLSRRRSTDGHAIH